MPASVAVSPAAYAPPPSTMHATVIHTPCHIHPLPCHACPPPAMHDPRSHIPPPVKMGWLIPFREKLAKNIGCPGTGNSGSQSVSWDSCNYTNVTRESFIHCNYHWNRCAIFFRKSKIKQRISQNITLLEEKGTFWNNKYFYGNFCRYLKFYNSLNVLLTSRFPPVWEAVHWIKGAKTMVLRSGQILFI